MKKSHIFFLGFINKGMDHRECIYLHLTWVILQEKKLKLKRFYSPLYKTLSITGTYMCLRLLQVDKRSKDASTYSLLAWQVIHLPHFNAVTQFN